MPPLDFPNAPTLNQTYTGPNNAVWSWDGAKWLPASLSGTGYAPTLSPVFQGNPTAPTPPGGDADTSIATTAFVAPAFNNAGRNLLHNPLFNVAQRGAGPFTGIVYTMDRWLSVVTTDTSNFYQNALADSDRAGIGDEAAKYVLTCVFTGNAAAGAYTRIIQNIEDVRRLGGKTVTLSFYAFPTAAGVKLGANVVQYFGSGGSPSASVNGTGQAVTLSAGWGRYSFTFVVPSTSGKTLGTNNDHYTGAGIWYSSGATNNVQAGNIGVQSGTINIWGVQLEVGSVATILEKPDPQQDLAKCQRFYQAGNVFSRGYNTAGQPIQSNYTFSVQMRAMPTVVIGFVGGTNVIGTPSAPSVTANAMSVQTTVNATGDAYVTNGFTASADL